VVNVHALIATGVNADGHREILGLDVTTAEDGAGWLAFFRNLTARGLTGVKLVTADAHAGLVAALGATPDHVVSPSHTTSVDLTRILDRLPIRGASATVGEHPGGG
jgi:hypothetical protein